MELRVAAAKSKKILRTKIRCIYFFFFFFKNRMGTFSYAMYIQKDIPGSSRFLENGMFRCMVIGAVFFLEG